MSTSPEDAPSEASAAATTQAHEPLACVSCRSRKLKCDRQKPVCARCNKAGGECVYPESRRKPAFKRRNVRELEERLAQVEDLLHNVGKQRTVHPAPACVGALGGEPSRLETPQCNNPGEGQMPWQPSSPTESPPTADSSPRGELFGLGQFERLPPFEMIEDLHAIFFSTQQHFLPIIHRDNYLGTFHSPPHMRPPMCLQYALWTVASNGHSKYGCYHDALYRRARHYLESDELRGHGEHFITIGHAQAWALVATDEARCLLFTRAAMSSARSIRLAGMMGLNRLDSTLTEDELPMAPMIAPAKSWAELEERRRLFWGGFCIDSYASISTGWPALIDMNQVTTHLPASEEAFITGIEETTSTLQDAFRSPNYSTFAGNAVVCYIFNQMMKHAQRPMPNDRPEDTEFGPFWKRHRELDNMLSSAFMFLPERYRLPMNLRDPVAVQTNLNLHAAVILLHNAACDKADKFKLPGIKQPSRTRALTAAQEIVDIIKLASYMRSGYKGPLMALSLYCAATVYVSQAKDKPEEYDKTNLELLVKCMSVVGREHAITRAYLNQIMLDIERNGLSTSFDISPLVVEQNPRGHGIPLVARGSISRHTKIQPPLPGYLPLGNPQGTTTFVPGAVPPMACAPFASSYGESEDSNPPASKRMRTSAGPDTGASSSKGARAEMPGLLSLWSSGRPNSNNTLDGATATALFGYPGGNGWSYAAKYMSTTTTTTLPHRTGSPAMNNSQATSSATASIAVPSLIDFTMAAEDVMFAQMPGPEPPGAGTSFAASSGNTNTNNSNNSDMPGMDILQSMGEWGFSDPEAFYAMLAAVSSNQPDDFGTSQDSMEQWASLDSGDGGSSARGSWDTSGAGGSG